MDAAVGYNATSVASTAAVSDPTVRALAIAKPLLAPLTYDVLRISLAARGYSPTIETQRQLGLSSPARAACGGDSASSSSPGWVEIVGTSTARSILAAVCPSAVKLDAAAVKTAVVAVESALAIGNAVAATPSAPFIVVSDSATAADGAGVAAAHAIADAAGATWPWDHVFPAATPESSLKAEGKPIVILYADASSASNDDAASADDAGVALALYRQVRDLALAGDVQAVYRHWLKGASGSGDSASAAATDAASTTTWLSGYGVGLDVKSTEYKVIDDRGTNAAGAGAADAAASATAGSLDASDPSYASLSHLLTLDNTLQAVLGSDPLATLSDALHGPLVSGGATGAGGGGSGAASHSSIDPVTGVDWQAIIASHPDKARLLNKAKARVQSWYGSSSNGNNSSSSDGAGAGLASIHPSLRASSLLTDRKLATWETGDLGLQVRSSSGSVRSSGIDMMLFLFVRHVVCILCVCLDRPHSPRVHILTASIRIDTDSHATQPATHPHTSPRNNACRRRRLCSTQPDEKQGAKSALAQTLWKPW